MRNISVPTNDTMIFAVHGNTVDECIADCAKLMAYLTNGAQPENSTVDDYDDDYDDDDYDDDYDDDEYDDTVDDYDDDDTIDDHLKALWQWADDMGLSHEDRELLHIATAILFEE